MNKKFLKYFGSAALIVALGSNSCVKPKIKEPLVEDNAPATMASVPDKGTEYNEVLARKSRRLAGYVLDKHRKIFESEKGMFYSSEPVQIEDYFYRPSVFYKKGNLPGHVDLSFWMCDTRYSEMQAIFWFGDEGLDGRVNDAILYYTEYDCGTTDEGKKNFNAKNEEGLEHKEFFQKEYEKALDTLLDYYEQNNK